MFKQEFRLDEVFRHLEDVVDDADELDRIVGCLKARFWGV